MIPESISKLTTERVGDSINQATTIRLTDLNTVIDVMRSALNTGQIKKFEEGKNFYKSSSNEKDFIRNCLLLFCTTVTQQIKQMAGDDDTKQETVKTFEAAYKTLSSTLDMLYTATNTFLKDKNIIDVEKISCIMLGYATETIRQNRNNKNNQG